MNEKLYDILLSLPKQALLNVMIEALEEMQSYNGQSTTSAVMRAIGGEESEDGRRWKVPSTRTIAKRFRNNFPVLG